MLHVPNPQGDRKALAFRWQHLVLHLLRKEDDATPCFGCNITRTAIKVGPERAATLWPPAQIEQDRQVARDVNTAIPTGLSRSAGVSQGGLKEQPASAWAFPEADGVPASGQARCRASSTHGYGSGQLWRGGQGAGLNQLPYESLCRR